jgi:hypothetical protein
MSLNLDVNDTLRAANASFPAAFDQTSHPAHGPELQIVLRRRRYAAPFASSYQRSGPRTVQHGIQPSR